MQFHTHANLGFENLDLPVKSIETEGIWLNLPKGSYFVYRKFK